MDTETIRSLVEAAREALDHAYAPYSNFPVGAALLMKNGEVITGVNVENVSFGATNCAERTALFTAISRGYQKGDVMAMAVAGKTEAFLSPCNICRQVMVELMDAQTPLYLTRNDGEVLATRLSDLVPMAFDTMDL